MSNLASLHSDLFLVVDGPLDALAVEILRPKFDVLVQGQADVVIDLSQTAFIDSSGIGAIVFLFKRLRELDRSLSLVGVHGQPLELLEHLRINKTIAIN